MPVVQFKPYLPSTERRGVVLAGPHSRGIGASVAGSCARQHRGDCFFSLSIGALCVALVVPAAASGMGIYQSVIGAAALALTATWQFTVATKAWKQMFEALKDENHWQGIMRGRRQMLEELQEQGIIR